MAKHTSIVEIKDEAGAVVWRVETMSGEGRLAERAIFDLRAIHRDVSTMELNDAVSGS